MRMFASLIFNLLFYSLTVLLVILFLPLLLLPVSLLRLPVWLWAGGTQLLLRLVLASGHRIRGQMPKHPVIYAAKHQSAWETIILYARLGYPAPVLKQELLFLPLFGLYLLRLETIPINRQAGLQAMRELMKNAAAMAARGKSILIFPQGTRVAAGADHPYHPGTFAIYQATGLPVVPIALNAGLVWPRNAFMKTPGIIDVELLPEIEPGLDRRQFMKRLENAIETATDRLPGMAEARRRLNANSRQTQPSGD